MDLCVGVLALQGAFARHAAMLRQLDVLAVEVRTPQDLEACQGLIIPGGESTVISRHMHFAHLFEPIKNFAEKKPLFGTCAGLILMANRLVHEQASVTLLNLMDIGVERNSYGRQSESFSVNIEMKVRKRADPFPAVFIRAPRIRTVGREVKVLASYQSEPVFIEQGHYLAATFHPELTDKLAIHRYFIEKIRRF